MAAVVANRMRGGEIDSRGVSHTMKPQRKTPIDPSFTLRLVRPDETTEELHELEQPGGLSPSMTLRQFFERWFRPIVLVGQSDDAQTTIGLYEDALNYWERLTLNPPLRAIDDFVIAEFTANLRTATYKRGKLGKERPLKPYTIAKHLKNIRAILGRIGPTQHPKRPGKAIVTEVPYIMVKTPQHNVKPSFPLETARRIAFAARSVATPDIPGIPVWRWWNGVLSGFFFLGVRVGTVWSLRWDWLHQEDDGYWFKVPASGVKKTHKAINVPVHPLLLQAIMPMRTADPKVFPRPFCTEHFRTLHFKAQEMAGIAKAKQLSPQAWRRTHGQEMVKIGAKSGVQAAQLSLDHADAKTTVGHYVTLADLMRKLPWLADLTDDPRQAKLFD